MRIASAKFPGRIRNRLIIMFMIPTMMLVAVSGWYYYRLARSALEEEMGLRLRSLAGSAVEAISGESVANFSKGDESGRAYLNSRERLRTLLDLGDAERSYVFDQKRGSLLDTQDTIPIGKLYIRLDADRWEIDQVFSKRVTMSSTLFTGDDGRLYKTGYAPITVDGRVVAVVGVDAGVRFFQMLKGMRKNMFIFGLLGVFAVIVVGFFVARGIERPVGRLVVSAQKIGIGDLEREIVPTTRDEIGFLANALNEMRQSINQRDRFLQMLQRGIAHEVRNPLGGMELFCDILADELEGDEDKIAHVDKIRREINALNKVVNDFLDFTREVHPDIREVDLELFFGEILIHYAFGAQNQHVTIKQVVEPDLQLARLDPELIRRALFNLINNGLQAMPDGGTLTLTASQVEEHLLIRVTDTGYGIRQQDLENIFTPFFTTKDKGTGLGLPLAKKIAENHGGTITIESKRGQGTSVTFFIPLTEEH